jgi:hypothetical protein
MGVESVRWEFEKDNLQVRFDAQKINASALLQAVDKFGFKAKIVPGPPSP